MSGIVDFEKVYGIDTSSSGVVDALVELRRAELTLIWRQQHQRSDQQQTDKLLTYEQAAERLGMSKSYIATMVRQGRIESVTLPATRKGSEQYGHDREGRARRIKLSVVEALMSAGGDHGC